MQPFRVLISCKLIQVMSLLDTPVQSLYHLMYIDLQSKHGGSVHYMITNKTDG